MAKGKCNSWRLWRKYFFTRYLVAYPSDGLTIYGFMNVPKGEGPYPVIIAIHGYIDPALYNTLDYTTGYADALARSGFLVIHPNLRGYLPSDDGPNLFRVGMAVDVLNLIGLVKNLGGQTGSLKRLIQRMVYGAQHGGGISTRVMTVSPDVDAIVLYAAMSGDEKKNYERIFNVFSEGQRGQEELNTPDEDLRRISPENYLDRIQSAISIHHGTNDSEVPPEWSQHLCDSLQELNKSVECFTYPGQPHTFLVKTMIFSSRELLISSRVFSTKENKNRLCLT
jgi:dienelactone hydrolase